MSSANASIIPRKKKEPKEPLVHIQAKLSNGIRVTARVEKTTHELLRKHMFKNGKLLHEAMAEIVRAFGNKPRYSYEEFRQIFGP